jgi:IS5 family transposase
MTNEDFFRSRLEQMIDLRHPLVVLARRIPWGQIEAALSPSFQRRDREGQVYYEPRLPCDATQLGRFRRAMGEAGVEALLKATIETAVATQAVRPTEFERIIVDSTVQEKAIAHPVDSRLLEIARAKVVQAAKAAGIALKQTFAKEGKDLRRKAGGYAHAKQFNRLRRVVKRQRTVLGIVLREIQRKLATASGSALALTRLHTLMTRAERIRTQQPKDKNKLYALHAPEVECISKGKARKRYEFGVKTSIAVTHRSGLMVGARTFPGNPYDGHTCQPSWNKLRSCWRAHWAMPCMPCCAPSVTTCAG